MKIQIQGLAAFVFLLFGFNSSFAQVAVYKSTGSGTWIWGGEELKLKELAYWVFALGEGTRVIKIQVYPLNKTYLVQDTTEQVLDVVGPKSKTYTVLGFGLWQDENLPSSFLMYESLVGVRESISLGGMFGKVMLPKMLSGPTFDSNIDAENGNDFTRGTRTLTLDSKNTQYYNSLGGNANATVQSIVYTLSTLGYRPSSN